MSCNPATNRMRIKSKAFVQLTKQTDPVMKSRQDRYQLNSLLIK